MANKKVITVEECRELCHKAPFPQVRDTCPTCKGQGEMDVSYHGSASWEKCTTCKGKKTILRPLSLEDKVNYLAIKLLSQP